MKEKTQKNILFFPTFNNTNIKIYYFLIIFMNGWFILPNWVFYFAKFITIPQIGIIDGISKLVGILLEIPSGAISDLLGKKKTLILGNLCIAICCLILISVSNFSTLLLGNIIMFIGFAFNSGAREALLYDSMKDINKEDHYDEVLGKVTTIATFTTIVSVFLGGYLYSIEPKLTFVAWMVFSLSSIILLIFMKEPISDEVHVSYSEYISKLKTGVKSVFNKPLITFVFPVLFFSMLMKAYEGVIRQNTGAYFGFSGETFGYLVAFIFLPTLYFSYNYKKILLKFKDKFEYLFIALYFIGFSIVIHTNNTTFGIISFVSVYAAQELAKPYIVSLINKNTLSKHRATALSTVSLFSEFPYMIVVIFGSALIVVDRISYLYALFAISLLIYILIKYLHRIKISQS